MTLFTFILTISTAVSITFMFLKHPLTLGLTLMLQTLLICSASSLSTSFSWFSYILFMIFLGATLVLFIYVASLAPNEIMFLSGKLTIVMMIPIMITPLFLLSDQTLLTSKTSIQLSSISPLQIQGSSIAELSMIYNPPISNITTFVIIYLLMTLLIVVKLASTFYGPLRLS